MLKIAIVGRPNTGKSTLFNRLAPSTLKSKALITDIKGYTRDRKDTTVFIGDIQVILSDTAGFEAYASNSIQQEMRKQTFQAIEQANLCLFMIDAKDGVLPIDNEYAHILRKANVPTIIVVNKVEKISLQTLINDAYKIGFGEPLAISAKEGLGIDILERTIEEHLKSLYQGTYDIADVDATNKKEALRIAIIGRPNAGKSSLINALLDEKRLIESPVAGSTRDSIEVHISHNNKDVFLYDTAGLRKKSYYKETEQEKLSVDDAFKAIRYAHIVILLMDYSQALEVQDLNLANHVKNEGRCLIFAFSKWDLVKDKKKTQAALQEQLMHALPDWKNASHIFLSVKTKKGINEVMDMCFSLYEKWQSRISTSQLNRWLESALQHYQPPMCGNKRVKIRYITQIKARPPSFVFFCSQTKYIDKRYKRYLFNSLKTSFEFFNIPIRLKFKSSHNPYTK